jgi:hypothetical protein
VPVSLSVRPPLLRTRATTSGSPVADRSALGELIAKFDGGRPPGPIERYIRTPTRFTSRTPPAAGAAVDTSAQITA